MAGTLGIGLGFVAPALATASPSLTPTTAAADTARPEAAPSADAEALVGPGYQLATAGGDVLPFGNALYAGTAPAARAAVVAIARTPTGNGYWEAGADGGVFAFGDAPFLGSVGGTALTSKVVGMAATSTGQGYWLVSADGGVFAFGDAGFAGSLSGTPLTSRVVGMSPTPSGDGYWLASADGGVFAFGDAGFAGSISGTPLTQPVVGIAATPSGGGYWLLGADGGVFAFGDADFLGSATDIDLRKPAVGIAPTPSGDGYWVAASDGGVFTMGDAAFAGSTGGNVGTKVVGITGGLSKPHARPPAELTSRLGHDISWPQCGGATPAVPFGYGIVGVTGGRPFRPNKCLADQFAWALQAGSGAGLYVNLASPPDDFVGTHHGPAGSCSPDDLACRSYNYGFNNMAYALSVADQAGARAPMWWLDVETMNFWTDDTYANSQVVQGAIDGLRGAGVSVGVYSTPYQWRKITGGMHTGLPVWVAGAPDDAAATTWCTADHEFGGGKVWLVQALPIQFDNNWACDPVVADPTAAFHFAG